MKNIWVMKKWNTTGGSIDYCLILILVRNSDKFEEKSLIYGLFRRIFLTDSYKNEYVQSIDFLKKLPYCADININGIHIAILHYSLDKNNKYKKSIPDPDMENCRMIFSGIDADVILYGHVHKASINRDHHRLYANFGSIGCPGKDGNIARAGILSVNDKTVSMEQVIAIYDIDRVISDINRLAYPASDEIKAVFY